MSLVIWDHVSVLVDVYGIIKMYSANLIRHLLQPELRPNVGAFVTVNTPLTLKIDGPFTHVGPFR